MATGNSTVTVPARFNGPLDSGNGGYSSGVFAARLGSAASVSLRSPVPLDRPLEVVEEPGEPLRVFDGETLVAEAEASPSLDVGVPEPVSLDEAREAAANYRAPSDGVFSRCFVCGRARQDSFEVFAGELEGREVVASPWTPPEWTAGAGGEVAPEFIWAVLDCPTYFAAHIGEELTGSVLVRQSTRLHAAVPAGEEHVVIAWPIERDGRKRLAGSAVLSADGDTLASAEILLIEPRPS
jgi:hypothetical protein